MYYAILLRGAGQPYYLSGFHRLSKKKNNNKICRFAVYAAISTTTLWMISSHPLVALPKWMLEFSATLGACRNIAQKRLAIT